MLQTTLRESAPENSDAKRTELEEVQSRQRMREEELVTRHDAKTKVAAKLEQLRTQTASSTFEFDEMSSAARDDERLAKRSKVSRSSENSEETTSTAVYSALLAEYDKFKSRRETFLLENLCIPMLSKETEELRANVADIEKSCASANSTSIR